MMKRKEKDYSLTVIAYAIYKLGIIPIMLFTGLISHNIRGIWLGTILCSFFSKVGTMTTLIAQSRLKSAIFVPGQITDNHHHSISCRGHCKPPPVPFSWYRFRDLTFICFGSAKLNSHSTQADIL